MHEMHFLKILRKMSFINEIFLVVAAPSSAQEADCTLITLKLWRNGFTINERGLRSYNDPKNTEFLNAIKRGEVPIEIQQEIHSGEVRLDMEDHRNEEYTPPKIQLNVFSGKGYTLGRYKVFYLHMERNLFGRMNEKKRNFYSKIV